MLGFRRLFGLARPVRSALSRRRRPRREIDRRGEVLESRLAMAVDVLQQPVVAGRTNWVTVLANDGSSVFVQEVANSERDLFIADNASFFPAGRSPRVEIPDYANRFDTLSVRSGELQTSTETINPSNWTKSDTTATFAVQARSFDLDDMEDGNVGLITGELRFVPDDPNEVPEEVPFSNSELGGTGGTVQYEWKGEIRTYNVSFSGSAGNLQVTLSDTGSEPQPFVGRNIYLTALNVNDQFGNTEVTWENRLGSAPIAEREPESGPAPGNPTHFSLPDLGGTDYQYVPGTLSGTITLATLGHPAFSFQIEAADYGQEFDSQALGPFVPVSFGLSRSLDVVYEHQAVNQTGGQTLQEYSITGTFNTTTGVLTFRTLLTIGNVSQSVQLPLYLTGHQYGRRKLSDTKPTDFTLFDGHTFTTGLIAEMVNPRSAIFIESPIVTTGTNGGSGKVSLAASEIAVNSPVRAARSLTVPAARDTAAVWGEQDDGTVTERLSFNAVVSSNSFEIQIADDLGAIAASPSTGAWGRSQFLVSQTGSMSNVANVLSVISNRDSLPPASNIFVEVDDGDIYVEGAAVGIDQSYFLRSAISSELAAPFRLTTESRFTDSATGLIKGDTVAITLANDTFGQAYDSFAKSIVSIDTSVDRLRVQAAYRGPYASDGAEDPQLSDPLEMPFNYDFNVRQDGNLIVDALAANSGTVDFDVDGTLDLLATIQVESGDVEIFATDKFTVQSPIQVAYGAISVTAPAIDVRNSVRVVRGLQDEAVPDVSLKATAGRLGLADAIGGLGRVVLESRGVGAGIDGNGRVAADVVDLRSDGHIDMRTDANLVQVRTSGGETRLLERDSAVFEVRGSAEVTLIADGFDVSDQSPFGLGLSPALYADLYDTRVLTVSAPNGSVDVRHFGDVSPDIGNLTNIRNGIEDSMRAAGSVSIVSDLGSEVLVYDAPYATGNALNVKVTTTGVLPGRFFGVDPDYEGVRPVYIETTLNALAGLSALDGIEAEQLQPGDRVLVKDGVGVGGNMEANGIYRLLRKRFDTDGNVTILLVRDSQYDTTAELRERIFVRVTDGGLGSVNVGKLFVGAGFDFNPLGGEIWLNASEIQPRRGHVSVQATAITNDLSAEFVAGAEFFGDTIRAIDNGSIQDDPDRLLFDDVRLIANDLVLIKDPVVQYEDNVAQAEVVVERSVGIYVVVEPGSNETPWVLQRWNGINEDGFPSIVESVESVESINPENSRTRITLTSGFSDYSRIQLGQSVRGYDAIGRLLFEEMVVEVDESAREVDLDEIPGGPEYEYNIEEIATVLFVNTAGFPGVPTGGVGSLDPVYEAIVAVDAGSLRTSRSGIMYALEFRAINQAGLIFEEVGGTAARASDPQQKIETRNPQGALAFVVTTENGMNEGTGSLGRMLNLAQANGEYVGISDANTSRNDYPILFDAGVRRIELEQALPAIVDPLTIAPSNRVILDGTEVELTRVGQRVRSGLGQFFVGPIRPSQVKNARRLVRGGAVPTPDRVDGFEVAVPPISLVGNGSGEVDRRGATIRNFVIGGFQAGAAIAVNGSENTFIENVVVGRGDFGDLRLPNKFGIEVISSDFGSGTYTTILNSTVVASEEVGLQLSRGSSGVRIVGDRIGQPGASNKTGILIDTEVKEEHFIGALPIPAGALVAHNPRFRERVLRVSLPEDGERTVEESNGMLEDFVKNLYIGQSILMGSSGILSGDARIAWINFEDNELEIGLNRSILRSVSGEVPLTFSTPPRNSVQFNQDNIVVKSGAVRIVGTDVTDAIFDGIRVEGNAVHNGSGEDGLSTVSRSGTITIGGGLDGQTRELSADHVTVHSNQQAGIRIGAAMFADLDGSGPGTNLKDKYLRLKDYVIILGNYLGTNRSGASGLGNGFFGESDFVVGGERALDGNPADPGRKMLQDLFLVTPNPVLENPHPDDRDPPVTGKYKALYRPEDFAAFGDVGFDREGNFHGGGNLGGGDPPPFDPDPDVAW